MGTPSVLCVLVSLAQEPSVEGPRGRAILSANVLQCHTAVTVLAGPMYSHSPPPVGAVALVPVGAVLPPGTAVVVRATYALPELITTRFGMTDIPDDQASDSHPAVQSQPLVAFVESTTRVLTGKYPMVGAAD